MTVVATAKRRDRFGMRRKLYFEVVAVVDFPKRSRREAPRADAPAPRAQVTACTVLGGGARVRVFFSLSN